MFSTCFLQGITEHLKNSDAVERAQFKEYYSSLTETMFALLLAISVGADWRDIVKPLAEVSSIYKVAFIFYIVFTVFGVLNVLTGVFLESAAEFVDRDLAVQEETCRIDKFVSEMSELFEELDTDRQGYIDLPTFKVCMHDEKVQAYLAHHQLDVMDSEQLFNLLDMNRDGEVDLNEFVIGLCWLKGHSKAVDVTLLGTELSHLQADVSKFKEYVSRQLEGF